MSTSRTGPVAFPLFSELPVELRIQIWRETLPDIGGPLLCLFQKGCWEPRKLLETDDDFDPNDEDGNWVFEFHHELLDGVVFEVVLAFVNHEARDVALAWARHEGLKQRVYVGQPYPVFARRMDPEQDALYVPLQRWNDFLVDPTNRLAEPDIVDVVVDVRANHKTLAIPEAVFREDADNLSDLFQYFLQVKVLFIIVDAAPSHPPDVDEMDPWRPWKLSPSQGATFTWDPAERRLDLTEGEHVGGDELYNFIQEAAKGKLGEGLRSFALNPFEMRPVLATRK